MDQIEPTKPRQKIELSLAAARIIWPVYLDAFSMAQMGMANQLLKKMTRKK